MWDPSYLTRNRICATLQVKCRVLTTGPLGRSPRLLFFPQPQGGSGADLNHLLNHKDLLPLTAPRVDSHPVLWHLPLGLRKQAPTL